MAIQNPLLDILERLLTHDAESDSLQARLVKVKELRQKHLEEVYAEKPKLLELHRVIHRALSKSIEHEEARFLLVQLLADLAAFMVPPLAVEDALRQDPPGYPDEPAFCETDCARLLEQVTTAYVEQCTALGFMQ